MKDVKQELNKILVARLEILSSALSRKLNKDKDKLLEESPYAIAEHSKDATYEEFIRTLKTHLEAVNHALTLAKNDPVAYEQQGFKLTCLGDDDLWTELSFKHGGDEIEVHAVKVEELDSIQGSEGKIERITFVEQWDIYLIELNGYLLWDRVVRAIAKVSE